jgi:RasGEF domain/RasGEF N-terminal motif
MLKKRGKSQKLSRASSITEVGEESSSSDDEDDNSFGSGERQVESKKRNVDAEKTKNQLSLSSRYGGGGGGHRLSRRHRRRHKEKKALAKTTDGVFRAKSDGAAAMSATLKSKSSADCDFAPFDLLAQSDPPTRSKKVAESSNSDNVLAEERRAAADNGGFAPYDDDGVAVAPRKRPRSPRRLMQSIGNYLPSPKERESGSPDSSDDEARRKPPKRKGSRASSSSSSSAAASSSSSPGRASLMASVNECAGGGLVLGDDEVISWWCAENDMRIVDPNDKFVARSVDNDDTSTAMWASKRYMWSKRVIMHRPDAANMFEVRAATLNQMVLLLARPCVASQKKARSEYTSRFFCTYRSFTQPDVLFGKLVEVFEGPKEGVRYDADDAAEQLAANAGDADDGNDEEETMEMREQTLKVLQHWFMRHFVEWSGAMKQRLEAVIAGASSIERFQVAARFLEKSYAKKCGQGTYKSMFSSDANVVDPPAPIVPADWRSVDFLGLSAVEVARQFTITSYHFYAEIEEVELLDLAWSKAKLKHLAPNLLGLIENFNRLSAMTATLLVRTPSFKRRVLLWRMFIDIASAFVELNNFDGAMAVLSALGKSAVHRLKWTRESIGKRHTQEYERLAALFDPTGSYRAYREYIGHVHPPCLPFTGVYLTDLTFVEDGNSNFLEGGLVNVNKRALVHDIVHQVLRFRHYNYNLKLVPAFFRFLKSLPIISEDEAYALSLGIEPRSAKKKSDLQQ